MAASDSIHDGDFVILDVNGEKLSFVQITPKGYSHLDNSTRLAVKCWALTCLLSIDRKAKIGKAFVPAKALIGLPYGCLVEVTETGEGLRQVAR